jgi:hypothetical protein
VIQAPKLGASRESTLDRMAAGRLLRGGKVRSLK